jgi:WD40 repeat protein/serine/threonine protein kinase
MPSGETDPLQFEPSGGTAGESAGPPGTEASRNARPEETRAGGVGRIAGYTLLRERGRGGMAVVYEAWDSAHGRRVALKVLRPGLLGNPRAIARFEREARALSRLEHPGICPVYDAGVDGDVAYIAMRFIEGEPMGRKALKSDGTMRSLGDASEDEWLEAMAASAIAAEAGEAQHGDLKAAEPRDESRPEVGSTREEIERALEVCEKVALALHAAHEAGVIHRDIKPGNIVLSSSGEPCILDFGLAWDEESGGPHLSDSGDLIGTPSYASPEQLRGDKDRVDRRSDVYSLGATIFEYFTGRPPFDAPTRAALYQEILNSPPADPRQLNPGISRDLNVVIQTALEKDPGRRYQTALAFAEDLRRVRKRQPIRARPPGPWLRTRRWARRHPVIATAGLAIFLSLTVALCASVMLLRQKKQEFLREQGLRLAIQAASLASTDPGQALLLALEAASRTPGLLANNAFLAALESLVEEKTLVGHTGEVGCAHFSPDGKLVVTASKDDTARLWDVDRGELLVALRGHGANVSWADFSPDGLWVVTASNDGTARVWDVASRRQAKVLTGHSGPVEFAGFGPDGRWVVTASQDQTLRVWGFPGGDERAVLVGHEGPVTLAAISPGGDKLASVSSNGSVIVWEVGSFRRLLSFQHEGEVRDARFDPDGRRLVTASEDLTARIVEIDTGETLILRGHEDTVRTASFSPDRRRVLTSSGDNTARVWEADGGRQILRVAHYDAVRVASWSPDGRSFVTGSKDRTARIWDSTTGAEVARLAGHEDEVRVAVFRPDGAMVLTASFDGTARLWKTTPGRLPILRGHADSVRTASFSPDGRWVVTASKDQTARIWDAGTGTQRLVFEDHGETLGGAAFSPDGTKVVSWSKDGEGRVWDAATGKTAFVVQGLIWESPCAAFSPDGRRLLTVEAGTVRLRESSGGAIVLDIPGGDRKPGWALFSPDGLGLLVVPEGGDQPWVVEAASGREVSTFQGHAAPVLAAAFRPDGTEVATTSTAKDPSVRVWDPRTGRQLRVLAGHEDDVDGVAFDRSGRLLATAARDDTARVWSVESGVCLHVLHHASSVYAVAFSPDGARLVTASKDMTARVWDVKTGLEQETLRHLDSVFSAAFSPDGKWVVTASRDATARIWPVDPLEVAERFKTRHPELTTP